VLAQVDATDKGSKRKFSVEKVDILQRKRKRQREEGRFEALQYFDKIDEVKLTWADVLFDDEKEVVMAKKEASVGDSEHHDSRVNLRDIF
jgi:hypothetical protein